MMQKINLIFSIIFTVFMLSSPALIQAKETKKEQVIKKDKMVVETINLNKAGAKEIAKALKGVGIKKAQAIVKYRDTNGNFKTLKDLEGVKGIGHSIIDKNKSRIRL